MFSFKWTFWLYAQVNNGSQWLFIKEKSVNYSVMLLCQCVESPFLRCLNDSVHQMAYMLSPCFQGPLIATAFTNGYHWKLTWDTAPCHWRYCVFYWICFTCGTRIHLKHLNADTCAVHNISDSCFQDHISVCSFLTCHLWFTRYHLQALGQWPESLIGSCTVDVIRLQALQVLIGERTRGVEPNKREKKNISEHITTAVTITPPSYHCRTPPIFISVCFFKFAF